MQRLYHKEKEDYAAELRCLDGRTLLDTAEILIGFWTFDVVCLLRVVYRGANKTELLVAKLKFSVCLNFISVPDKVPDKKKICNTLALSEVANWRLSKIVQAAARDSKYTFALSSFNTEYVSPPSRIYVHRPLSLTSPILPEPSITF